MGLGDYTACAHISGLVAKCKINLHCARQMEGIAKAKKRVVYKGRKRNVDV